MKHVLRLIIVAIPCAAIADIHNNPALKLTPSVETIETKSTADIQSIQVHNKIQPKMLEYTFLKIGYCPDSFRLQVNGSEVKSDSSISIPSNQKLMIVRYDYSFARGWRTGAKEITFELDQKSKACDLEFSWHNEWRVIASGATPKKVKRVKYLPS